MSIPRAILGRINYEQAYILGIREFVPTSDGPSEDYGGGRDIIHTIQHLGSALTQVEMHRGQTSGPKAPVTWPYASRDPPDPPDAHLSHRLSQLPTARRKLGPTAVEIHPFLHRPAPTYVGIQFLKSRPTILVGRLFLSDGPSETRSKGDHTPQIRPGARTVQNPLASSKSGPHPIQRRRFTDGPSEDFLAHPCSPI